MNLLRAGFALLFFALAIPTRADELELVGGDVIRDCVVVEDGDLYRVTVGGFSRLVPKSDVRRWIRKPTREQTFRKRFETLRSGDVAGHLELAAWCRENGLPARADEVYRKILEFDADQAEARAALGYRRVKGRWLTEDEIMAARGLVKHQGRWMTPEERDLELALERRRELERRYLAEIRRRLAQMRSADPAARAEAVAALTALDDRLKPGPYLEALVSSFEFIRAFVAAELGKLRDELKAAGGDFEWKAVRALARRAVWDASPEVREAAIHSLMRLRHADTALALSPFLEADARRARMRAEELLAVFPDSRAAPALVDVLEGIVEMIRFLDAWELQIARWLRGWIVTKDGRRIAVPARVRFQPDAADREARRRLEEEKDTVHAALKAIAGADLGDDPAAWRAWLASDRRP